MSSAPLILSVETATLGGSVCITRGSAILASNTGEPRISHSHSLLIDINRALVESNSRLGEVDVFAVACGPGSFTGLRIGIATIKALAAALERPCAGVPSLQAVAHGAGTSESTVSLLPAGRGEVFAQMFSMSSEGIVTELDGVAHISPTTMLERYGGVPDILWAGEGSHVYLEAIKDCAERSGHQFTEESGELNGHGWRLVPRVPDLAQHVAALALVKLERNQLDTPSNLRAIYVRPSDAELNKSANSQAHRR